MTTIDTAKVPAEVLDYERMNEVAADRRRTEQLGKLGEPDQPVGVPRRPVRVVAVRDPVDDVVRLGGLVEQVGDACRVGAHDEMITDGQRWFERTDLARVARCVTPPSRS